MIQFRLLDLNFKPIVSHFERGLDALGLRSGELAAARAVAQRHRCLRQAVGDLVAARELHAQGEPVGWNSNGMTLS